ncbi:NAD(P)-binding domain-containing protein [Bordetella sp. FB-8]|uniref:NAD(P)-binding domain-containing protein n=1 Tax=Bordetella sp. FB-8 TaxID=1159870 RepID=UPI000365A25A|nr:NAD(P)-binding domain-containing protein [Bordetella sp. FB-8]
MNIAIIGLGEVGRCYAGSLIQAGYNVSLCEAHVSVPASMLASDAGLHIHTEPGVWLTDANFILSCVTGATSLPVLREALPYLQKDVVVADFTTASPAVKREGASLSAVAGVAYVDIAIMGAISLNLVRTSLLASGEGSEKIKIMLEHAGGKVDVIVDGKAGDAISLKILRSVFTKGMEALAVELLMSAEKQGVRAKLYEQLADIDQTPLRSFMDMLVRTHVVHAKRRAHEVHVAQSELISQGLESFVMPGVAQRFQSTVLALDRKALPVAEPTVDQAIEWLLETMR